MEVKHKTTRVSKKGEPTYQCIFVLLCSTLLMLNKKIKNKPDNPCNKETNQEIYERH